MKQPSSIRLLIVLSLSLLALALPTWAQDRSRNTEKKVPPKAKQPPSAKEGVSGAQITPPPPSVEKGVKEPSHSMGNNVPPNINPKEPAGNQTGNSISVNNNAFDKAVNLEILELLKEDAKAKPSSNLHERLVPVLLKWKGKSINQGKVVELEALLETVNTDGTKSRVTKKIIDLSVDKLLAETIILPMKEGTFARDFKLTLSGKCASGEGAKRQVVAISAVKQGSFPVPSLIEKKK